MAALNGPQRYDLVGVVGFKSANLDVFDKELSVEYRLKG
jgi:hypothetical protein